jgi:dynein light intermediate chain
MEDPTTWDVSDPSEAQADHIPVKKLSIGSWNLLAKYDEHVLLSFYWAERKLVWEVLHLGVVRKMEVDFEDLSEVELTQGLEELAPDKLVITLHRPPRFFKENPPSTVAGGTTEVNYVYTTDFTNGQASTESRHVLLFEQGAVTREHIKMLQSSGIRLIVEGAGGGDSKPAHKSGSALLRQASNSFAASQALRQPPTSSPRLDAILLQDQLKREMRERQARYTGICPVRERIYAAVFDELIAAVARDLGKRGSVLKRVHAESRMSIDAYRTVFEKSIDFGGRKLTQALQTKGQLAEMIEGLEGEIAGLKKEVAHLEDTCEGLAHRESLKEATYEEQPKEILDLEAEKQQLTDLIATLKPSKPEKGK